MPWSMNNPPPPAKNWSVEKKRRCIAAGNRALSQGKSEEDAIFACIGAAKTVQQKARAGVSKTQIELYQQEMELARTHFATYAQEYVDGSSLISFREKMQRELKRYLIRLALIAKGKKDLTDLDKKDLSRFLAMSYAYLDGFMQDVEEYSNKALASDEGIISRAASYGFGWGVFSRFTIPGEIADLLPDLPGLSCLGGEACGCWLEWEIDEEGNALVWWHVNLIKQNCVVCLGLEVDWDPYVITYDELVAEYGEDLEF